MQKILYICEATSGGVRKHIMDLLKNLSKLDYEITLIYSENRADEVFYNEINRLECKVSFIKNNYLDREICLKKDWKAFKDIYRSIKEIKPDIVHCHSTKAGVIGRIAAKLHGIKKIYYTPHAYSMQNQSISPKKKLFYKFIEGVLSRFCTTKTLNVSKGEKNFALQNKLDKENKFKVIYNGIEERQARFDKKLLRDELGINDNDKVIGVAARLDEQKDPWTFVKIAERILKKYKNVKFIYIGDGKYKEDLESYIKNRQLENEILLLGFRDDVENILQIFDIYLITSLYEGLPYSLIEALKAKLPIVATDIPGSDEVVINKYNGLLFEVQSVDDGVEKVTELLNRNYDVDVFKQNSYNLFISTFTIDKMIKAINRAYEE